MAQDIKELRIYIEHLEDRIKKLEDIKPPKLDLEIKKFKDTEYFPVLKTEEFIIKHYNQATEPTIPNNTIALWIDSDGGPAYYLIYNFNGTKRKVALT